MRKIGGHTILCTNMHVGATNLSSYKVGVGRLRICLDMNSMSWFTNSLDPKLEQDIHFISIANSHVLGMNSFCARNVLCLSLYVCCI